MAQVSLANLRPFESLEKGRWDMWITVLLSVVGIWLLTLIVVKELWRGCRTEQCLCPATPCPFPSVHC